MTLTELRNELLLKIKNDENIRDKEGYINLVLDMYNKAREVENGNKV